MVLLLWFIFNVRTAFDCCIFIYTMCTTWANKTQNEEVAASFPQTIICLLCAQIVALAVTVVVAVAMCTQALISIGRQAAANKNKIIIFFKSTNKCLGACVVYTICVLDGVILSIRYICLFIRQRAKERIVSFIYDYFARCVLLINNNFALCSQFYILYLFDLLLAFNNNICRLCYRDWSISINSILFYYF